MIIDNNQISPFARNKNLKLHIVLNYNIQFRVMNTSISIETNRLGLSIKNSYLFGSVSSSYFEFKFEYG